MGEPRAYYNDSDPGVCAWLRQLVADGLVMDGDVDERSIADVQPSELAGYVRCHFFAGIGGWDYALQLAGWPADRPVWTGSCPCQPFSIVGKRLGTADQRHLWPQYFRLITECRPTAILGEQVAGPDGLEWLDGVLADLEVSGYATGAANLCAAGVGAPHIRQRLYWVGYAIGAGLAGFAGYGPGSGETKETGSNATASRCGPATTSVDAVPLLRRDDMRDPRGTHERLRLPANRGMGPRSVWSEFDALACSDGWRRVRSGTFPMAHGVSGRMGRLRGYGNAIVPQVAAEFIAAVEAIHA